MTAEKTGANDLWAALRRDAAAAREQEPALADFLDTSVLFQNTFSDALCHVLADRLAGAGIDIVHLRGICAQAHAHDGDLATFALADLAAITERDPAARSSLQAFLWMKGFHALQAHRIAHVLWKQGRAPLAYYLQNRASEILGADIHPAAKIGRGVMMDHATGIVIGETAVVGDDVSMLHGVTLGGTGKESGDRHPKVGNGVLLGAGCHILGNIVIGEGAKVASGSVVLENVPPHMTVAGVPAKIICPSRGVPGVDMDQGLGI